MNATEKLTYYCVAREVASADESKYHRPVGGTCQRVLFFSPADPCAHGACKATIMVLEESIDVSGVLVLI